MVVRQPLHHSCPLVVIIGVLAANAAMCGANAEPLAQNSGRRLLPDDKVCQAAIQSAEQVQRLPAQLLGAIGLIESGRVVGQTGRIAPWPWTINVGGAGYFYDTKQQAIAAVQGYQAKGEQSIDVGCMQVNLSYHPGAFASLDQAFDPQANATYAAGFLTRLFPQSGSWATAAAAYHSQTPGVSDGYVRRVVAAWPMAVRYIGASMLATLAAGPGLVPPSIRAEPDRNCGVGDLSRYTPDFQKIIIQAAIDRAQVARDLGRFDLVSQSRGCGVQSARVRSHWHMRNPQIASTQSSNR